MKNQLNNDILLLENIWMDKMQSHSFPEYNSDTDEIDDAYEGADYDDYDADWFDDYDE